MTIKTDELCGHYSTGIWERINTTTPDLQLLPHTESPVYNRLMAKSSSPSRVVNEVKYYKQSTL